MIDPKTGKTAVRINGKRKIEGWSGAPAASPAPATRPHRCGATRQRDGGLTSTHAVNRGARDAEGGGGGCGGGCGCGCGCCCLGAAGGEGVRVMTGWLLGCTRRRGSKWGSRNFSSAKLKEG